MILSLFQNYKLLSDEQLVERIAKYSGDSPASADSIAHRAFEELYRRYARLLQGFFFRRTSGNQDLAQDLMQDTFAKVWQSLTNQKSYSETVIQRNGPISYNDSGPFRPWLFTIAYNLLKNHYRLNEHEQQYLDSLPTDEPIAEDNTPLQMDADTFDRALQTELSKLPEPQQLLFELRFTQEMTVPEIAVILNIPEGTVKSRLHTLTTYLRIKLKDYE